MFLWTLQRAGNIYFLYTTAGKGISTEGKDAFDCRNHKCSWLFLNNASNYSPASKLTAQNHHPTTSTDRGLFLVPSVISYSSENNSLCPWPIVFCVGESFPLFLLASINAKFSVVFFFFSIGKICSPSSLWCSLHGYVFSPRQCKEILFKSSEDMSAEIDRSAMYPWSTLAISGGWAAARKLDIGHFHRLFLRWAKNAIRRQHIFESCYMYVGCSRTFHAVIQTVSK